MPCIYSHLRSTVVTNGLSYIIIWSVFVISWPSRFVCWAVYVFILPVMFSAYMSLCVDPYCKYAGTRVTRSRALVGVMYKPTQFAPVQQPFNTFSAAVTLKVPTIAHKWEIYLRFMIRYNTRSHIGYESYS